MFFDEPGKPTSSKKAVYVLASTILGILMGLIIYGLFEINYLDWIISHGNAASLIDSCVLWQSFQLIFILPGAIIGFFLGLSWWQKVYVERTWAKKLGRR